MEEQTATGVVPADAEKLVNELAGMAYSYAIELDAATRDADHDDLEAVSRRITGKLKKAIYKALFSSAHDAEMAGLEASVGHLGRLVDELRPDAERYRAFFDAGLPITYLGEQYGDKAALDAAIDATRGACDGRA